MGKAGPAGTEARRHKQATERTALLRTLRKSKAGEPPDGGGAAAGSLRHLLRRLGGPADADDEENPPGDPARASSASVDDGGASYQNVMRHMDAQREHNPSLGDGGLRAAVFGMNDGLLTSVGLVLGVYASGGAVATLWKAGLSGLVAGASSMAVGEWISMQVQTEALAQELEKERDHLSRFPEEEAVELAELLSEKMGVDKGKVLELVRDMDDGEADDRQRRQLEMHALIELGIDPDELEAGGAVKAMVASFIFFSFGAAIPLVWWFPFVPLDDAARFAATLVASVVTFFVVGVVLSRVTPVHPLVSALRQVVVGVAVAGFTYGVGLTTA